MPQFKSAGLDLCIVDVEWDELLPEERPEAFRFAIERFWWGVAQVAKPLKWPVTTG